MLLILAYLGSLVPRLSPLRRALPLLNGESLGTRLQLGTVH